MRSEMRRLSMRRPSFGFAAGSEPVVVEASLGSGPPYLGDRSDVDGPVEAAVASPVEPGGCLPG